jgi:hypothetical protein
MVNNTLPTTLTQFRDELTHAIAHEIHGSGPLPSPSRSPRGRRLMSGIVVVGALAAAVAALLTLSHGSRNTASAAHVLRAADIALPRPDAHTIVYVSVTQTMTPGARAHSRLLAPTVNAKGWFQQGGARRSLTQEHVPGEPPTWHTGSGRIYDPASGRVYPSPPLPSSHPHYTLTKNRDPRFYSLWIKTTRYGRVRETITAAQAHALRDGSDGIQWLAGLSASGRFFISASVVSTVRPSNLSDAGPLSSTSLAFPAQLHRLLQSGNAHVGRRITIDGHSAIQITITHVSGYQRLVYDVNARTYRPVELLHTAPGTTVDNNPTAYFHHLPALLFW